MKKLSISLFMLSVMLFSCDSNDDPEVDLGSNLTLDISGLEDLGANYVYEGWVISGGKPVSTGIFSVSSGKLSKTSFLINTEILNQATTFVLTIEPKVGDVPAPSNIHVLAGDFKGNTGSLSASHDAALGNNFSSAVGEYILATPTDGMDNYEESGVWFLNNSSGTPAKGLTLPDLSSKGWKYEGWVVINGTPISTGTFTNPALADDNASTTPFKGTLNNGPAFPGEDYVRNAPAGLVFPTDLRGKKVVISIEPFPDNSPNPFTFKPLVHDVPATAGVHTVIKMNQNLGSFPTGSFSR